MSDQIDNPYLYALTTDPMKPLREAKAEIARLTAERDEALKSLAMYREFIGDEMMEAAKRRAGRG